jgi:hypothetical protein
LKKKTAKFSVIFHVYIKIFVHDKILRGFNQVETVKIGQNFTLFLSWTCFLKKSKNPYFFFSNHFAETIYSFHTVFIFSGHMLFPRLLAHEGSNSSNTQNQKNTQKKFVNLHLVFQHFTNVSLVQRNYTKK